MSGCGKKYLVLSMVEKFLARQRSTLRQGFQASNSFRRPSSNLHIIRFSSQSNFKQTHRCSEYTGRNPNALLGLFLVRATWNE